jgi:TolB protein
MMKADGSEPLPVTPRKGGEGEPVWSPDGQQIIFVCDREDSPGNLLDVCETNADGTGERRLLFHRDHDTHPVVSPDGGRIAFVGRGDGNVEIYLMNRDGSGLLRVTRDPAEDQWPEWSPDGKKLLFLSNRTGRFAIYEITL